MKRLLLLLVLALVVLRVAFCQERPTAQITFRVTDDEGSPVENAELRLFTFHHAERGEGFGKQVSDKLVLTTDASGSVVASMSSLRGEFTYSAFKRGSHYDTLGLNYKFASSQGGKWQPWNPTVNVELRRIRNPIPLFACMVSNSSERGSLKLPAFSVPVGFDLQLRDWIAPYGKGRTADITFRLEGETNDLTKPYDSKLTMTFGHPLNGIVEQQGHPFQGSKLRLPHLAPEGGYKSELIQRQSLLEGVRSEGPKEDQNYFLRIRSKTDAKGNLVSAQYAKIHGDIQWAPSGWIRLQYYLNPTPNDRNLEFDVKRNLMKVQPGEEVREP